MSQEDNQDIFLEMPIESLNMPDSKLKDLMKHHILIFRRAPATPTYKESLRKAFSVTIGLVALVGRVLMMILALRGAMGTARDTDYLDPLIKLGFAMMAVISAFKLPFIVCSFQRYFSTPMTNLDAHEFHDEIQPYYKLELSLIVLIGMIALLQECMTPAMTTSEVAAYQPSYSPSASL